LWLLLLPIGAAVTAAIALSVGIIYYKKNKTKSLNQVSPESGQAPSSEQDTSNVLPTAAPTNFIIGDSLQIKKHHHRESRVLQLLLHPFKPPPTRNQRQLGEQNKSD